MLVGYITETCVWWLTLDCLNRRPPVLFWGRIFLSAQRRERQLREEKNAEDQRQQERDVSLAALTLRGESQPYPGIIVACMSSSASHFHLVVVVVLLPTPHLRCSMQELKRKLWGEK